MTAESLMARSWDEPFTLYGLLAESIEVPPDRAWVRFRLREGARFSDGTPLTVADVIWSFETLGTEGHPRYRNAWASVSGIEETGPREVTISFADENPELPLIMALRPILQRAQWEGRSIAEAGGEAAIGSGPYTIAAHEPGRFIEFAKDPNWWGADLPVNRGLHNFETIRIEYFRDGGAYWEAVKAGEIDLHAEYDPVRWAEGYDFPALTEGRMGRDTLSYARPSGWEGFVFNTRREIFADRRVREALTLAFDWEWVNERLFRGGYERIQSPFGRSPLGFEGEASPGERAILEGFDLPPGTLEEGWRPPISDGSGRDRRALRAAGKLLDQAGWVLEGPLRQRDGQPLSFEILVSSSEHENLASLWAAGLKRLGVEARPRLVDNAQFSARRESYDYDVTVNRWGMSLSPGVEQRFYFHSSGREAPGTRNYMGVADLAVDAAIAALLAARDRSAFQDAVRALDRVLTAGIYVVPFGVLPEDRLLHTSRVARPEQETLYGWWGWQGGPARWWAVDAP